MLAALRMLLQRWVDRHTQVEGREPPLQSAQTDAAVIHADEYRAVADVVPYDENLLERARTQWQFGDWASLAKLDRDSLQHHPDRAKLALLATAGLVQQGDTQAARQFARLAQDWGCSKKLISQILIAGVHNSLGRAAAVSGQQSRAQTHFHDAIAIGAPASEIRLLTQARTNEQLAQLGLHQSNTSALEDKGFNSRKHLSRLGALADPPDWIVNLVDNCLVADDVLEDIDCTMAQRNFSAQESFLFFMLLSDRFRSQNDDWTALHFLSSAREHLGHVDESYRSFLAKKFIDLGRPNEATDVLVQSTLSHIPERALSDEDKKALELAYRKTRINQMAKGEHGHETLLAYIRQQFPNKVADSRGEKPIFIEIGTTREEIPGQGSTRKIAEFCMEKGFDFITIDMDPHNTRVAARMFGDMKAPFAAINMKGEDYLRDYIGSFDFVFLDAYDFDHGKHSKLRQSRYKKFLGAPIDDAKCHKMHLDCAKAVVEKLSRNGLVCIDDTWLEDGNWTAKGTLAMPYLLEHGFCLLDARNHAALLGRTKAKSTDV